MVIEGGASILILKPNLFSEVRSLWRCLSLTFISSFLAVAVKVGRFQKMIGTLKPGFLDRNSRLASGESVIREVKRQLRMRWGGWD